MPCADVTAKSLARRGPAARHDAMRPHGGLPRAGAGVPGARPGARPRAAAADDAAILDLGVQDTGPDGSRWALELRGSRPPDDLFLAWTLRGAPHAYRRPQSAKVAAAGAVVRARRRQARLRRLPAAEAGRHPGPRRSRPDRHRDADIAAEAGGEGRDVDRAHRAAAASPSGAGATRARRCTSTSSRSGSPPCVPGSSSRRAPPPGAEADPGMARRGEAGVEPALDPVRGVLRFLGPATPKQVAEYVDAPLADVKHAGPTTPSP